MQEYADTYKLTYKTPMQQDVGGIRPREASDQTHISTVTQHLEAPEMSAAYTSSSLRPYTLAVA